jgi:hypothetical protein
MSRLAPTVNLSWTDHVSFAFALCFIHLLGIYVILSFGSILAKNYLGFFHLPDSQRPAIPYGRFS